MLTTRGATKMVLIVEDSADLADLIRTVIVSELRYYTLVACDGEHAQRYLHSVRPSLIVLDVNLPHISGLELYDMVQRREDLKDIPVLFLTAAADDPAFKARGFQHVVPKPFKLDTLLNKVSELCCAPKPAKFGWA